jgi:hypothetical protein
MKNENKGEALKELQLLTGQQRDNDKMQKEFEQMTRLRQLDADKNKNELEKLMLMKQQDAEKNEEELKMLLEKQRKIEKGKTNSKKVKS